MAVMVGRADSFSLGGAARCSLGGETSSPDPSDSYFGRGGTTLEEETM